jgi:hypothetical protein
LTDWVYTAIDAIIVGIQTQSEYLGKKASWTRRIILVTDGDHPIEIEDWERTAAKMNELNIHLTIVYVGCGCTNRTVSSNFCMVGVLILTTRSCLLRKKKNLSLR